MEFLMVSPSSVCRKLTKTSFKLLNHSHMCLHLKVSTYKCCCSNAVNQKISTFQWKSDLMASRMIFEIIKNESADFCLSSKSDSITMSINICSSIDAVINICSVSLSHSLSIIETFLNNYDTFTSNLMYQVSNDTLIQRAERFQKRKKEETLRRYTKTNNRTIRRGVIGKEIMNTIYQKL